MSELHRLDKPLPSEVANMDNDTLDIYKTILHDIVHMVYSVFHSDIIDNIKDKLDDKSTFDSELYILAIHCRWPNETHFCAGCCVSNALSDYRMKYPDGKLPKYLSEAMMNVMVLLELMEGSDDKS